MVNINKTEYFALLVDNEDLLLKNYYIKKLQTHV